MRNILITGGAGFIGSNFCHYWAGKYPQDKLIVLDLLTYAGHRENIQALENPANFVFVQGDIGNQALVESIFTEHQVNCVIHFAAESHVDRSIQGPEAFLQTNIMGTHTLLKVAKKFWLDAGVTDHHFHHVSTDEVYGSLTEDAPAFTEATPFAPNSPYSASKAASDHLVRAYHHTYGLKVTTSNCSNNYGPYQDSEKLIPLIIQNILQGKALPIYGDGKNIRDWLYVEDHCRAIDLILHKGKIGEVYNVGGENEWRNIDIVNLICAQVDAALVASPELLACYPHTPCANGGEAKSLITFVKDRPGHDRRYAIDPGKCHAELGYHPMESFESGIVKTIQWLLHNQRKQAEQ